MIKIDYPDGATPLSPEELEDLIPEQITTQKELNAIEQMNIAQAGIWLEQKNLEFEKILDEIFIKKLHKEMYGNVWKWAGMYRKTGKNIGIDWLQIQVTLRQLLDDVKFQIKNKSYVELEIAVRFHHKLVWIHPFPNGNGRHARIITDYLLKQLSGEKLSWGGGDFKEYSSATKIRKKYITALRAADTGEYKQLMAFVTEGS